MSPHPLLSPIKRPPRRKPSLVMAHLDQWMDFKSLSWSQLTVDRATEIFATLRKYLAGREPTPEIMLQYIRGMCVAKSAPATISSHRTFISQFFNWAVDMGYAKANPLKLVPRVPARIVHRPPITADQYKAIREHCVDFWYYLCTLAWYTGARSSDIVDLRWQANVRLADKLLVFTPRKTAKSGRVVSLPMSDEVYRLFALWWEAGGAEGELVCPEAKTIHDRHDGSFQYQFRKICRAAGVPDTISFHCFRHARATRMLNGSEAVNPIVAAEVLGLSNLATLRRYTTVSDEAKLKAINL